MKTDSLDHLDHAGEVMITFVSVRLWTWQVIKISLSLVGSFFFFLIIHAIQASFWCRWYRICLQCRRLGFNTQVGKIPWTREWLAIQVSLPGKFNGQRSLAGYRPCGHEKSDTTELIEYVCSLYLGFIQWSAGVFIDCSSFKFFLCCWCMLSVSLDMYLNVGYCILSNTSWHFVMEVLSG